VTAYDRFLVIWLVVMASGVVFLTVHHYTT